MDPAKEKLLKDILQTLLQDLVDGKRTLDHSISLCKNIVVGNQTPEIEDLDRFETLTSRFARMSDILTQKIFRTINEIDLESDGTTRDFINRAAKKGFIDSEETFFEIRELRNRIAHEYAAKSLIKIFEECRALAPVLSKSMDDVIVAVEKKYALKAK